MMLGVRTYIGLHNIAIDLYILGYIDGRLEEQLSCLLEGGRTNIAVVVCLMWAVDVLSKISEILCILGLLKVAKVVIISGT